MARYDFYQSGIKQGSFDVTGINVTYAADSQEPAKVDDKLNIQLSAQMKVNPTKLFNDWQEELLNGNFNHRDAFTTGWGAIYEPTSRPEIWIQREAKPAVNLVVKNETLVGFQISVRNLTTILIRPGYEKLTVLKKWDEAGMLLTKPHQLRRQFTEFVAMRDGTKLATEIFLPDNATVPLSTVLVRTPYGRELFFKDEFRFVERGYVLVVQDTRGRNDSEGEWLPMYYERDDGQDTIEWIAEQSWSNQKVGMIGGSYGGYVQWAAASSGTPYLKALVSMVTAGGPFTDTTYKNGAPLSGSLAWFFSTSERKFKPENMIRDDWEELMKVRPLSQIPVKGLGHEISGFSKFMNHHAYDEFYENMDWKTRSDKITVPALIQSGWYDDNGVGTTEAIRVTDKYPKGLRKIILGPWLHSGNAQYDLGPVHLGEKALRLDIDLQHFRWFDHFLNGVDNHIEKEAVVDYYILNTDTWKQAETFPPNKEETKWWLDAKTAGFSKRNPEKIAKTEYDYDPDNPAPHLIDVSANELEFPNDYREVEARTDVVSFTSPAFDESINITGWFKTQFFASSSAVNTDWVARLTDVTPDGESINIADNVVNATFHDDIRKPELLIPGKVYQFEVETQKTSIQLQPGHKLRLDITSSANNLVFPNSNTAEGPNGGKTVIAHQTIYTGGQYPSKLIFNED